MKLPAEFSQEVEQLFRRMDQAYYLAVAPTGFVCRGCEQNCCLTCFYHHTFLEYFYLRTGLEKMPSEQQVRVRQRAKEAMAQLNQAEQQKKSVRVMCPLNVDGRCALYDWRPMICRLHGIPHLLRRPDGRTQSGSGCDDFYTQCTVSSDHALDRTPLYVDMAKLEKRLRQHFGFNRKIKMTIAEMIVNEIH